MQFEAAIDLFSSAEAWPMGVFVKRYFLPRSGINRQTGVILILRRLTVAR